MREQVKRSLSGVAVIAAGTAPMITSTLAGCGGCMAGPNVGLGSFLLAAGALVTGLIMMGTGKKGKG